MKFSQYSSVVFSLVIGFLAAAPSEAEVIVDTTGASATSVVFGPLSYANAFATPFMTGNGTVDITMTTDTGLLAAGVSIGDSAGMTVDIFSESGGLPGASVLTYTIATITAVSAISDRTITPSATFQLAANTNYWLVVAKGAGGFDGVEFGTMTDPGSNDFPHVSGNGTIVSTIRQDGANDASPGDWSNSSVATSTEALQFQINGTFTAIPEPTTMTLLTVAGIGGLGAGYRRWRKKKKAEQTAA